MELKPLIENIFSYEEMGLRRFSKGTYEPSFEKFQSLCREWDEALDQLYDSNKEDFCDLVSGEIVLYVQKENEKIEKKSLKEDAQRNHNMFMVSYVFPHILEMRNEYYKDLTLAIEKRWSEAFKGSKIKGATYETIAGGFQKKFLGFSL